MRPWDDKVQTPSREHSVSKSSLFIRSFARHAGRILLHNLLAVVGCIFFPLTVGLLVGFLVDALRSCLPYVLVEKVGPIFDWIFAREFGAFVVFSLPLGFLYNRGLRDREACLTWVPSVIWSIAYLTLNGWNSIRSDDALTGFVVLSSAYSAGAFIALFFKARSPAKKPSPIYTPLL
jgi:hypothetical protein